MEESVLHAPLIQMHHKTLSMIEIANVTKVILETTGMYAQYVMRELTRVQQDRYHAPDALLGNIRPQKVQ